MPNFFNGPRVMGEFVMYFYYAIGLRLHCCLSVSVVIQVKSVCTSVQLQMRGAFIGTAYAFVKECCRSNCCCRCCCRRRCVVFASANFLAAVGGRRDDAPVPHRVVEQGLEGNQSIEYRVQSICCGTAVAFSTRVPGSNPPIGNFMK